MEMVCDSNSFFNSNRFSISPNGKYIVLGEHHSLSIAPLKEKGQQYQVGESQQIRIVDKPGGPAIEGVLGWFPAWSADGKAIVFRRREAPNSPSGGIYAVSIEGGIPMLMISSSQRSSPQQVAWSSDWENFAFTSRGHKSSLHVDTSDSVKWIQLAEGADKLTFAWSRDGKHLVYAVANGLDTSIWIFSKDTGKKVKIAENGWAPVWCPKDSGMIYAYKEGIWFVPMKGNVAAEAELVLSLKPEASYWWNPIGTPPELSVVKNEHFFWLRARSDGTRIVFDGFYSERNRWLIIECEE